MPKIVLVTGASSGMGRATALRLIAEGHTVYGAARRVDRMAELEERGGNAVALDVTDESSAAACIEGIVGQHGTIDVLVNNAGYGLYGAVEDTTIDDARHQFEVNLFGAARLTRHVLPYMRRQGSGTIVNVTSMGGKIYTPLGAWYHASKHALEAWSDCLRLEVGRFGIDVVIVEPGIIATEFGAVLLDPLAERSKDGPYEPLATAFARATEASYGSAKASDPAVVAETIARAVEAGRPRTRYVVGRLARPLVTMRKYLSDRQFDRVMMRMVR